jgi:hypothetical protein
VRTHRSPFVAALTVTALALAGCGTEDPEAVADEPDGDGPAGTPVVEVELVDFAFVGLPATVAAGTRLEVVNRSEQELHELVALPLADDAPPVADLLELPPAEAEAELGHPAAVLLAAPGSDETIPAVGDGVLEAPGRYAIVCFIPTGADPQAYLDAAAAADPESGPPQVPGGPPHVVHGMATELVVEEAT